ncbi:unnamed protein product, partial [Prorocentrum cordatum]
RTRGTPADQDPHAAACRGAAWNGGSARRPAPHTQPCPRPAVLRPAGARPAGARPLAGASPCLRRTRDLPLEAEAAARSSRGNIDGPNNPTKHGRELLGGHMPHANPTPTPQDF